MCPFYPLFCAEYISQLVLHGLSYSSVCRAASQVWPLQVLGEMIYHIAKPVDVGAGRHILSWTSIYAKARIDRSLWELVIQPAPGALLGPTCWLGFPKMEGAQPCTQVANSGWGH